MAGIVLCRVWYRYVAMPCVVLTLRMVLPDPEASATGLCEEKTGSSPISLCTCYAMSGTSVVPAGTNYVAATSSPVLV